MAESKNQHYVPRHYLRRFSLTGGKRIHSYVIKTNIFPPPAPIRTQCSGDYFYAKDTNFEKILTKLEGRAESLFSEICETDTLPKDMLIKRDLLAVLGVMQGRTRISIEQRDSLFDQTMKTTMRKDPKFEAITSISKEDLDKFRFTDQSSAQRAVVNALLTGYRIGDLDLRILKSETHRRFITSDHPVVVVNQAFAGLLRGVNTCGLSLRGIQLILPLDPIRCLFAFDPNAYRIGSSSRDWVTLTRSDDIDAINCLQLQNADEHLYFQDEPDSIQVRQLINRFGRLRGRVGGFARTIEADDAGATSPSFVVFEMPEVRIPLPWSFCHVRKGISSRGFGLRDPELNAQLDAYHRDILMKQRLVPFHVWSSEQQMLRRPTASDR
jgi:Protein of unknown function (DUF4238)